jgi:hypothetical protein
MITDLGLEPRERDTDDLFDRVPVLASDNVAGLDSRHLEQIANESIQPPRFVRHGCEQLLPQ